MKLPRVVQREHALRELGERAAQARQVQRSPRRVFDRAFLAGGRGGISRQGVVFHHVDNVRSGAGPRRKRARRAGFRGICLAADVPEEVHAVDQLHREEPLVIVG